METSSNTFLLYHIVFSTKKRKKLISSKYRKDLHSYMAGIVKNTGGMPILINGTEDHVHILAFLPKHVSISECMQSIKGGSSFWYNKQPGNEYQHLYWQEGYSIFTVSGSQLETVKNYIFRQEEHHRAVDFDTEMQNFLTKLNECYRHEENSE